MASIARTGLIAAALAVPGLFWLLSGDPPGPAPARPTGQAGIAGTARALDGDTLEIGVLRIRLFGIDAPEFDQTCERADGTPWQCGRAAASRLAALAASGPMRCVPRERDHFGRIVASCTVDGADVAAAMARDGMAWAFTRYSETYLSEEAAARSEGIGIWQGAAETAWDYRASGDWQAAAGAPPDPDCTIKGNVSGKGERIYHLPGSAAYARTRISAAAGEAWFCSEAEAQAAGWRPPRGG